MKSMSWRAMAVLGRFAPMSAKQLGKRIAVDQVTEILDIEEQIERGLTNLDFLLEPQADDIDPVRFAGIAVDDAATRTVQAAFARNEGIEILQECLVR